MVPLGVLYFTEHFGVSDIASRWRLRAMAVLATIFSTLSLSPWMVAEVTREPYGMRPIYGPLHPFFAGYMTAQRELAQERRGAEQLQLLTQVVARIADEIKNPLVSINAFMAAKLAAC